MSKSSFNHKFIAKVIGFILILESLFMFVTAAVSKAFEGSDMKAFLISGVITLFCGVVIVAPTGIKNRTKIIGKRESYLSVAFSWLLFAVFGALPFVISGSIPNYTDAFFEAMSGITTTGGSVLTNIDSMPHGILFWRSLLQWLGGMGIIVFSLALLPLLGGEAAQLFDAEASGLTHDKFRPRVTQMAKRLWGIYVAFTIITVLLLWLGPMNTFDAICHGFTAISTGGFSTKQESIAFWNSSYVEIVLIVAMLVGAINFPLLYFLFQGKIKKFAKDEELRWFISIVLVVTLIVSICLIIDNRYGYFESIRYAAFQVIATITTTGYSTADFSSWGSFHLIVFTFLMVVCGCAGSTSGGLKTVRAVVLAKNTLSEFERLIHPRAIIPVRLNDNAISFGVVQRLLAFAFLYICIIFVSWGVLTLSGISFVDSFGASVSAIGNVGPGFGVLGPAGSYADIPTFTKWYLSFLMIVGRLEIFTILILFTPKFWKE
ncbi:trk system potassium uptake protein TrkH [Dysgonomonadaceae bacterium PH5-43]|nr:trk system potassium uptake protein TrkH [Dysgonomonadaceae bacterium PH5-43]